MPLTLLAAPTDDRGAGARDGARFAGDIAALCAIARPTVGVDHEHRARPRGAPRRPRRRGRAKGELLEALADHGLAVLDAGDPETPGLAARTSARVVPSRREAPTPTSGSRDVELDAELRPSFRLERLGCGRVTLAVRGAHQVVNAALAAAVALARGVAVRRGRGRARHRATRAVAHGAGTHRVPAWSCSTTPTTPTRRRWRPRSRRWPACAVPGRRIAVLGEMRELGDLSDAEHRHAR